MSLDVIGAPDDVVTQWAAVKIQVELMAVPPQMYPLPLMTGLINTYQGVSARFAGTPPTIRVDGPSLCAGGFDEIVSVGSGAGVGSADAAFTPRPDAINAVEASTSSDLVTERIGKP